jgi:epoxyqueuosine reductase QueG
MGNSGERKFLDALDRLTQDEDPIIAEHAEWAIGRLRVDGAVLR